MASYPISRDHQLRQGTSGAADDDEFEQKEDVAAGISDTLDRYTVETTFKEYLANADDCESATQLNWLLDEREDHPKQHLLTKELRDYQGPALLVHNDGGM
jgi:sacsin